MSHVTSIKVKIASLDALKSAAEALGLEFHEGQKTFRWYGRHVGDYPLPEGFSKEDMGKCEHALSIPGNKGAYEIGVCKARDGSDNYELLWDFWGGGFGLEERVGEGAMKLCEEYSVAYAKQCLEEQGYMVIEEEIQEVTIG